MHQPASPPPLRKTSPTPGLHPQQGTDKDRLAVPLPFLGCTRPTGAVAVDGPPVFLPASPSVTVAGRPGLRGPSFCLPGGRGSQPRPAPSTTRRFRDARQATGARAVSPHTGALPPPPRHARRHRPSPGPFSPIGRRPPGRCRCAAGARRELLLLLPPPPRQLPVARP